jgi:glycosyltransferase involved in cell wall biosynthesis
MAKILYMSDSPTITTGYGRVSKMLCDSFVEAGHTVIVVGWGQDGDITTNSKYQIVPCDIGRDRFGEDIIAQLIRREKPDILFTLGDPWMTEYIPQLEERKAVTWISYFPIDGYPIPPAWRNWIANADVPVVFSKFAKELIHKTFDLNTALIYHGVDTKTFKPMDKAEIKAGYNASDLFIIGTVARNQPRKNLPALIKAFSIFAKNKPDTVLYMHTQIRDAGWNIDELVNTYGISDKAFTTSNFNAIKGISDIDLVKIYNLFDLFVLPTMAEGFGLPILEAQSCGIPVLVTDFSACSELVADRQGLVKVKDTIVLGRNIEQAIIDVDNLVHKMDYMYYDWKRRNGAKMKEISEKGRKFAEQLDWKFICSDFNKLLDQVVEKTKDKDKTIYPQFYRI